MNRISLNNHIVFIDFSVTFFPGYKRNRFCLFMYENGDGLWMCILFSLFFFLEFKFPFYRLGPLFVAATAAAATAAADDATVDDV